jgi:hypothetical protein
VTSNFKDLLIRKGDFEGRRGGAGVVVSAKVFYKQKRDISVISYLFVSKAIAKYVGILSKLTAALLHWGGSFAGQSVLKLCRELWLSWLSVAI